MLFRIGMILTLGSVPVSFLVWWTTRTNFFLDYLWVTALGAGLLIVDHGRYLKYF